MNFAVREVDTDNGERSFYEIIRKRIDLVCIGIILISVLPIIISYFKNKSSK